MIIHLNRGNLSVGAEDEMMAQDSFYFFPAGQPIFVKHAMGNHHDLGPMDSSTMNTVLVFFGLLVVWKISVS